MKTMLKTDARDGSLIIAVIIALMAMAFLGAAALSMATSARFQRVHVSNANRAYYLAESGASYVRSVHMINKAVMPAGTFTLSNGDQFIVNTVSNIGQIIVQSTGIANPGTHIEARRRLTFVLTDIASSDVLPLGFDFDDDGAFDDDMWTAVNVDPAIRDTGPSGGQPSLDLKGEQGQIYLNWQDQPDLNLQSVWAHNGGLLSYDVQVKIKPFETGNEQAYSKHYMLGISFRLHPDINNCYGISYFRSLAGTNPGQTPSWVREMPAAFQNLRGTNVYLLLWYRNGAIDTMDLINYRLLTPADPVIHIRNELPELADYATILLALKERYGGGGARENLITAYIQGLSAYPLWNSPTNAVWQENTDVFPAPVTWNNGVVTNVDGRLTSADFNVNQPAEIGIHVFYDREGANLKFFDDFAIRMEGYGSMGGTQIQY